MSILDDDEDDDIPDLGDDEIPPTGRDPVGEDGTVGKGKERSPFFNAYPNKPEPKKGDKEAEGDADDEDDFPTPKGSEAPPLFPERDLLRKERATNRKGHQGVGKAPRWSVTVTVLDPGACLHKGVFGYGSHVGTLRGLKTDYSGFVWDPSAEKAYQIAQALAWCLTYDEAPKEVLAKNDTPIVQGPPCPRLWPVLKEAYWVDAFVEGVTSQLWVQGPDALSVAYFARQRIDKAPSTWNHRVLYLQSRKFHL